MRRIIALVLMTLAAASATLAKGKPPVGDWQTVQQDIPRGWGLEVVTSMTFPCTFERATADELICMPIQQSRRETEDVEIHIRRDRIREIRVEKREGANMLAGGGSGAGLGAILGALLVPGFRGPSAYLLGLGGASIGARRGSDIHILRGKVVYRRAVPEQEQSTSTTESEKDISSLKATQNVEMTAAAAQAIVQTLP